MHTSRSSQHLSVEPLEGVVFGEDGPVGRTTSRIGLLLGVNAVQLGRLALAGVEDPDVNVRRARFVQGRDLHLSEQVNAVGSGSNSDLLEVCVGETGEVVVAQVGDSLEVLLLVFCGGGVGLSVLVCVGSKGRRGQ